MNMSDVCLCKLKATMVRCVFFWHVATWFLPTPVSSLYTILVPKCGRLFNVDKIFTHLIQIVIIYSLPY